MRASAICIICLFLLPIAVRGSVAEVAVIANPSVPIDHISGTELLDLYSGDVKEWSNGSPVVVIDLKPRSVVKDTFYKYLGKSPSRMKSIWMKAMLSGEGQPPQAKDTEEEIVKKVAQTPGAIGYVDRNLVTEGVIELAIIPVVND